MKRNPIVIFIILVYIGVIVRFSSVPPYSDGVSYFARCLVPAVFRPFALSNFSCFGHQSFGFFLPAGLSQYLDPGNSTLWIISIALMGILAVFALYQMIIYLFPDSVRHNEQYFVLFLFALHPVFVANTINPNLDIGVVIYELLFMASYFKRSIPWVIFWGMLLIFSKETGIAIYVLTLIWHFFYSYKRPLSSESVKKWMRDWWSLGIPIGLFVLYAVYARLTGNSVLWQGESGPIDPVRMVFHSVFDKRTLSYGALLFILQFHWVYTLGIVSALVWAFCSSAFRKICTQYLLENKGGLAYIVFLFVTVGGTMFYFRTYSNPRYLLPLYPPLILLFYASLVLFIRKWAIRMCILVFMCVITFISCFYTIDPVTKVVFGTFQFGIHPMAKMTSISGECCGYGKDQLVYNTQYTYFQKLKEMLFQTVSADDSTPFVTHSYAALDERVDVTNHRYSYYAGTTKALRSFDVYQIMRATDKPKELYFIWLPNIDNTGEYQALLQYYVKSNTLRYTIDGYTLETIHLVMKNQNTH